MTSHQRQSARPASRCSSTCRARSMPPRAKCRRRSTRRAPTCRPTLRSNPTYRKANPADAPVMILALTSATRSPGPDLRRGVQRRAAEAGAGAGRGRRRTGRRLAAGGARRAAAVRAEPLRRQHGRRARRDPGRPTPTGPKGAIEGDEPAAADLHRHQSTSGGATPPITAAWSSPGATARRSGCRMCRSRSTACENTRTLGLFNGEPAVIVLITPQPGANVIETVDGVRALLPELQAQLPQRHQAAGGVRPHHLDPLVAARDRDDAAHLDRAGGAGGERVPAQRARHLHPGGRRPSSRCSAPSA